MKSKLRATRWPVTPATVLIILAVTPVVSARADTEPDGESVSPVEFLPLFRAALTNLKARFEDAQIDGRRRTTRYSINLPDHGFAYETSKPPGERNVSGFYYIHSGGNERLRWTNGRPIEQIKSPARFHDSVIVSAGPHKFTVSRTGPEADYFLSQADNGPATPSLIRHFRDRVRNAPYCPGGFDFPEFAKSPQFKVAQVSRTIDSGKPVLKAFFNYVPATPDKPSLEGWIRLEESMDLAIRDYQFKVTHARPRPNVIHVSGSVSYGKREGASAPTEVKYKDSVYDKAHDKTSIEDTVYEIDRFTLGPTPPEAFTLGAFGLGDFERPSSRASNNWSLYLIIGAAIALSLSAVCARASRSSRGKANPSGLGGATG
jgi:hypothetical protein